MDSKKHPNEVSNQQGEATGHIVFALATVLFVLTCLKPINFFSTHPFFVSQNSSEMEPSFPPSPYYYSTNEMQIHAYIAGGMLVITSVNSNGSLQSVSIPLSSDLQNSPQELADMEQFSVSNFQVGYCTDLVDGKGNTPCVTSITAKQ